MDIVYIVVLQSLIITGTICVIQFYFIIFVLSSVLSHYTYICIVYYICVLFAPCYLFF